MHPFFISHIVADFLLQPTNLVLWKEKHKAGLFLHAAIHAGVMLLFTLPATISLGIAIVCIAALHGLIDAFKIHYQKKNPGFDFPFLLDQCVHAAVLIAAAFLFPLSEMSKTYVFWQSEAGKGMAALFFFWSFFIGFWHIKNIHHDHETPATLKLRRTLVTIFVFALFLIPSLLFAASNCFAS